MYFVYSKALIQTFDYTITFVNLHEKIGIIQKWFRKYSSKRMGYFHLLKWEGIIFPVPRGIIIDLETRPVNLGFFDLLCYIM